MLANLASRRAVRVAVVDYAGHAFPAELSRALAAAGHQVLHLYCPDIASGHGRLAKDASDSTNLEIEPITLGKKVNRYSFAKRATQELVWGRLALRRVQSWKSTAVLLANVPLLAQIIIIPGSNRTGAGTVLWQQDVHARAAADVLGRQLGALGRAIAVGFLVAERRCARASSAIITITESFRPVLEEWGVDPSRLVVQPNWAPLSEVVPSPKDNGWSRKHGLWDRPTVMYAGTLSFKHDPSVLVELARSLVGREDLATVVVVTEGIGRDFLGAALTAEPFLPIQLLDFQPYEDISEMLAAADVLTVLLEPAAGTFSVPSKILSYLCAGRPVVAAVPLDNQAARVLLASGAAQVVEAGKTAEFISAVKTLIDDSDGRRAMGLRGRQYAESSFNISDIWPIFSRILTSVAGPRRAGRPASYG